MMALKLKKIGKDLMAGRACQGGWRNKGTCAFVVASLELCIKVKVTKRTRKIGRRCR